MVSPNVKCVSSKPEHDCGGFLVTFVPLISTWRRDLYSLGNHFLTFRCSWDLQSKDVQKCADWRREKHACKLVLAQFQFKKKVSYWFWIRPCSLKQCFALTTDTNLCVSRGAFSHTQCGGPALIDQTVYQVVDITAPWKGIWELSSFGGIAAQNLLLP